MHANHSVEFITLEYSYVFNFEKSYSYADTQKWLLNNIMLCYSCGILYLVIIASTKYYMIGKPKFNLRRLHILWHGLNLLFSIIGFIRTAPELFFALRHRSFYYSVCTSSNYFQNPVSGFWTWALVLWKLVQLCDTIFIVLQKYNLTFLHAYCHLTIIPYFWFTYIQTTAIMRWFSVMDYLVHSYMYSFYTLKTLKFKLPKIYTMTNHMLQMVQTMISGILILMVHNLRDNYKLDCRITYENAAIGIMYHAITFYFHVQTFSSNYLEKKYKRLFVNVD